MSTAPKRLLSPQEYLAQERLAEFRSEYYRGEVLPMAPATWQHSLIKTNVAGETRDQLRHKPYQLFTSDHNDTILNPILLAEVYSPATEAYDRGPKFDSYRHMPSLQVYILISQESPIVEHWSRNTGNTWTRTIATDLDQSLVLPSIGVTLTLAEIYGQIEFTSASPKRPS